MKRLQRGFERSSGGIRRYVEGLETEFWPQPEWKIKGVRFRCAFNAFGVREFAFDCYLLEAETVIKRCDHAALSLLFDPDRSFHSF